MTTIQIAKVSANIDDSLVYKARILAAQQRTTLSRLIEQALREKVERESSQSD